MSAIANKEIRWTPRLIRELRGNRTPADFGALLRASRNSVSRWEAGKTQPDAACSERLSQLADQEHFLKDWNLVGSVTLLDEPENAQAEIAALFSKAIERSARQLAE